MTPCIYSSSVIKPPLLLFNTFHPIMVSLQTVAYLHTSVTEQHYHVHRPVSVHLLNQIQHCFLSPSSPEVTICLFTRSVLLCVYHRFTNCACCQLAPSRWFAVAFSVSLFSENSCPLRSSKTPRER